MTLREKLRKWKYNFLYRNSLKLFIIGFLLLVVISPFLFTLPAIFAKLNFSESGQIGDTIGGLTSPVIGFFGAILVYLSFQQQLKANQIQSAALENEIKRSQQDRRYNSLSHDIDVLRQEINSFQLLKSDMIGTNAIYQFKEMFVSTTDKETITKIIMNAEPYKNFYFLIATTGNIYDGVINSNLEIWDMTLLHRKLIYLYTSKLAIYLFPIIIHCDAHAIDNDTIRILKSTYERLKKHINKNNF